MISIIICSRQNNISPELQQNIKETIGVDYEIVVIDNSKNQHSIFSAYNLGVTLSRFPFLLFMHDDIKYHSQQWGVKLIDHFSDSKVGCVGIAGTPYLSYAAGGWWSSGAGHLHLLQSKRKEDSPVLQNYFPENSIREEVVVLDGVWVCIRRELFNYIRFDEETFGGFHFYDVDTTLQAYYSGYKLLCVKDILIHHLSMGVLDQKWVENAIVFHRKWKHKLPVSIRSYNLSEQCAMEYRALSEFIGNRENVPRQKKSSIYLYAFRNLLSFKKGYQYYKTPFWALLLLGKGLKNFLLGK